MRKWVYSAVVSCPGQADVFEGRVFTTGAGEGTEPGDSPERPFLMIRFSTKQPPPLPGSRIRQQRFQVWIHTAPGSMLPNDDFADALEDHIPSLAPTRTSDGDVIMEVKYEDTSGDGYDDHYGTSTRYVTFLATYNDVA